MLHDDWQTWLRQEADEPGHSAPAGIAWLPELALARFAGPDVRKFLQGYLTCDADTLTADRLTPTALCNLKGRVVMNGWCYQPDDAEVHLLTHVSLMERLESFFRAYLMFSKTRLTTHARDVLVFGTLDLDDGAAGLVLDARRRLLAVTDLAQAQALWQARPHLASDAWLGSLTVDGVPLITSATSERFLPQMLDLEKLGAIDFAKGCYLGQEVVARAQHRGQVKRRLARLTWQGPAPEIAGDVTDGSGRSVGVLLQRTEDRALAVLQQDATEPFRQGDADLRRVT